MSSPDGANAPVGPAQQGAVLDLVDALAQLSFLVHNVLGEVAAGHDLSIVQTRLLGILRDREPTMNELARHLRLDKSSVTGLVSRAQDRGLVTRTVSTSDRRSVLVSMTAIGRKLAKRVEVDFVARIEALTTVLSETDRTRLSLLCTQILSADAESRSLHLWPSSTFR